MCIVAVLDDGVLKTPFGGGSGQKHVTLVSTMMADCKGLSAKQVVYHCQTGWGTNTCDCRFAHPD